MKTIKIGEFIHLVSYSCDKRTICNKLVPPNSSFIERKSLWETTCPKCKKTVSSVVLDRLL